MSANLELGRAVFVSILLSPSTISKKKIGRICDDMTQSWGFD